MQGYEEQDCAQKFSLSIWKRLLGYARPFYPHLIGIAAAMLVCAATDAIFPVLTREAIDVFLVQQTTRGLGGFALRYAAVVLLQTACAVTFCLLSGRVEAGMCRRVRAMGFERLQRLPMSYFDKTPIGYVIARMTSDTQRLGDTVGWSLIDLVWGAAVIVFSLIVMLATDWRMSLAVIAAVPLLALATAWFQRRILRAYRAVRKDNSLLTGAFNEGVMGAGTTKTLGREDAAAADFGAVTGRMERSSVRAATLSALFLPVVVSLSAIAASYVLWKGGYDVFRGAMTFGTLTMFVSYSTQMFEPVQQLARVLADMLSAQAAAERVLNLIETPPEDAQDNGAHPDDWPEIRGAVQFSDVSFTYGGGEEVLEHFSLDVKAGETIALVGETGSGKSTIVNLLCRFYRPTSGALSIDGVDYRGLPAGALQAAIGYVLQEPHLFSGSVRENIRYGRLDATDAEIEEAAKRVSAHGFIAALEKGYDTDVGEGGSRLSTGQKQLISLARALVKNPRLFVLDEATSSVDTETEMKIQAAIETLLAGRTSFIVAHRLSTVRNADRILVIDKGRVAESGDHRTLMAKKGAYWALYTGQFRAQQAREALRK